MTFWQIWLRQPMQQPNWWGLGRSVGTPSARCVWRARPSSADWATLLPSCLTTSSRRRLRFPGGRVKGMRIIAAHAYHRIDYDEVWVTLRDDVPRLDQAIKHWRQAQV